MAIAYVGTGFAGPLTAVPAVDAASEGDLLLAVLLLGGSHPTPTAPSGWSLVATDATGATASDRQGYVYSKVATSSEPDSYAWTDTSSAMGVVVAFSGATAVKADASAALADATVVRGPALAGVAADDALVVMGGVNRGTVDSFVPPVGLTEVVDTAADEAAEAFTVSWKAVVGTSTSVQDVQYNDATDSVGFAVALTGNRPPNAPIVDDQGPFNRAIVNRVPWASSDPDAGDSQSAADLRYREDGTSTWTTVNIGNPNQFWDSPAGTFIADLYEAQVRTADQAGVWGPFSASFFITAADAPAGATITSPTSGATIGTSSVTVEISAAVVDESEYRLYADDGTGSIDLTTQLQPAVVKTTGVLREHEWTGLANSVPVWLWVRIKQDGLWSEATTQRNPVSYTPPPTPTLTITPVPSDAEYSIAITNPTPDVAEPAVSYNDLYVRCAGWMPDADPYLPHTTDGTRVAMFVMPNGTTADPLPASGVAYEYRAVAVGDNGTVADSGWVATTEEPIGEVIGGGDAETTEFADTIGGGTA